jgi:hypothetical protein
MTQDMTLEYPTAAAAEAAIASRRKDSRVRSVGKNTATKASAVGPDPFYDAPGGTNRQWGIGYISFPNAWQLAIHDWHGSYRSG